MRWSVRVTVAAFATYSAVALALPACGGRAPSPAAAPAPTLATTGAITGTVRDRASGDALSFATVMVVEPKSEEPPKHTDTTGADGHFAIEGLPPGTYDVTVFYSNLSDHRLDLELAAGQRVELDLELDLQVGAADASAAAAGDDESGPTTAARGSRGVIDGTVTDQVTGEPLEGAVVAATTPELRDAHMAVTDERGEFRIVGLPPGTYKLSCYYRLIDYGDIEVQRTNIAVEAGRSTSVPLRLDTSATSGPE